MVTVTELWIYPVKSCGGISLDKAQVTLQGLDGDRQWMIVDADGKFLTQRQYPQLALVKTQLTDQALTLDFPSLPQMTLPRDQTGALIPVTVWRNQVLAQDQGEAIAQWFSEILQTPCRLVRQAPDQIRPINPNYALWENQPVSFADGYPILLTNAASLADLTQRLGENMSMNRFRPNLVVSAPEPFAEDHWQRLQTPDFDLVTAKPCERCVVTTIDPQTGDRHPAQEPLNTLKTFRHKPQTGILFGINVMPTAPGTLQIGDRLAVISQ